ncbi:MAG: kynurenine formamidase [Alphaproteobacteria bacterium]|jgi:kynurenine formamidase
MHRYDDKDYQFDMDLIKAKTESCKQWGKWGPDDEWGTQNYVTDEDRINAAKLVKKGHVFALGLNFDDEGPQNGLFGGRWNPIHTMLATGTDAVQGKQMVPGKKYASQYADDSVSLPLQCGTQWDALGHVFNNDKMWNGYDATLVGSRGAEKCAIHKMRDKMVGRGVLLDIARWAGVDSLEDGTAIDAEDLDACAKAQGVEIRRGDTVIYRTGHMERCLAAGEWGGYAGGNAPGVSFHTCDWMKDMEIAAICADTWGCEVIPNETDDVFQPWHWIVIPMIGITMGEIFYLKDLANDCADDGVYEFMFVAPPLPVTRGVGSPINPQAIK